MSLRFSALLVLAILSSVGCTRPATQLLVVVESDLPPARRACVQVALWPVDDPTDVTEQTFHVELDRPTRVSFPFSFGVTAPGGDPSRRIELRISARPSGAACSVEPFDPATATVTRRVRSGFLPGQMLRLPVFLSSDCDGVVCSGSETCDYGSCIPVPEVDPGTLVITRPGDDLLDSGVIDAAIEEDAGLDGGMDAGTDGGMDGGLDAAPDVGPGDGGPPFAPTRPLPRFAIERAEPGDPHGVVYPVGASDANHVIVAGVTTSPMGIADLGILGPPGRDAGTDDAGPSSWGPFGRFFLAKIEPNGTVAWRNVVETDGFPYPVVRRVLPLASGTGYVICGTASAPFYPDGVRRGGSGAWWTFVARLDVGGGFVPGTFHRLDAFRTGMGPTPELWCQDLAIDGDRAVVAARVSSAEGLYLDGAVQPLAPGGDFRAFDQNLLLYEIQNVATSFDVQAPLVVGRAPFGFPQEVGLDGMAFFVRVLADGSRVLAADADDLAPSGSPSTTADPTPRVVRVGSSPWSLQPVATADRMGVEQHLRGLVSSETVAWLAIQIQVGAGGPAEVTFGAAPSAVTVTVPADATYLVRLDALTGSVLGVTRAPEGIDVDSGEDPFTNRNHVRGSLLGGHGMTLTEDGHALLALATANGELLDTTPLTVTGEFDPLLAIVGPDGSSAGAWQWTETSYPDWRLTHVEWMSSGFVAVAGYVEDNASPTWRREASFFHVVPIR